MKLSFATLGCPNWKLEKIVGQAKTMGFDGVELRGMAGEHIGPNEPASERKRIRQLFESAGLEICCLMGYSTFAGDLSSDRERLIEVAIQLIDVAHDVGCPCVREFGGLSDTVDWSTNFRRVVEGLKRVAAHAEKKNVRIAFETHDAWCQGERVRALGEAVGSPQLGVCWDVGNSFFVEPLEKTGAALGDRLFHVHFKDAARENGTIQSKLPGQGQVALEKALRIIHRSGYAGYLSFEWEKKWNAALTEPEIAFPHYLRFCRSLMETVGVRRG